MCQFDLCQLACGHVVVIAVNLVPCPDAEDHGRYTLAKEVPPAMKGKKYPVRNASYKCPDCIATHGTWQGKKQVESELALALETKHGKIYNTPSLLKAKPDLSRRLKSVKESAKELSVDKEPIITEEPIDNDVYIKQEPVGEGSFQTEVPIKVEPVETTPIATATPSDQAGFKPKTVIDANVFQFIREFTNKTEGEMSGVRRSIETGYEQYVDNIEEDEEEQLYLGDEMDID